MRTVFWVVVFAVFAAAGWFAWALLVPVQPAPQTFVMLRPGYSTRHIASELKSAGVIRSEEAFIFWHYLRHRRSLKAGEYLFEKPANTLDVQGRLGRGDVYFHTVVVPEGFTMFDIARAVEAAGLGPAQDFLKVAQTDTSLISDIAPHAPSLEGFLFPDTYQFSRMMTMHEMAAAMVRQFREVGRQIGLIPPTAGGELEVTRKASSLPEIVADTDIEETVIMASIIEKETAVSDERPLVASVYYNRLAKNIALDADPSVIYAELLAGTYTGALHHDDMQFPSRYNTYKYRGLPPGPIGNPGQSALEAAMHPAQSDYYYFVADATGHHRFAQTIEEHNKNVAAYRRALRAK
ncbi:MAG: endolytic transglycosylase MltG [Candidatus Sulfotelmatobacter sp.]